MTKIVQLAGGSSESQDGYVGPARELTVDESNWDLRLHDGSTLGGRTIQSQENADQRYQAKSLELDGLNGFEAQERGVVVRQGPADYILRSLLGTAGQILVENGDGNAGDIAIRLAEIITIALRFTQTATFDARIVASNGVDGDTFGTHTGNVVGNLVGNVTGNLLGNAVGNHSGSFEGSIDVSDGTAIFAPNQIPTGAIANLATFVKNNSLPAGSIIMWSGSVAAIPTGWRLCDGTGGTPDLRERFVLGYGGPLAVGAVGGSTTHSHTGTAESAGGHAHTASAGDTALSVAQMPTHRHKTGLALDGAQNSATALYGTVSLAAPHPTSIETDTGDGINDSLTGFEGSGAPHTHTVSVNSGGAHTHTVITGAASVVPPYLVLAFIMKE